MLHQPTDNFQPPCECTALDAVAYIDHMRAAGMTIYPLITPAGRRTYGVSAANDRAFEAAHDKFREAYDKNWNSDRRVFDALCDAAGLDPDADDFNERVSTMFDREDETRSDDKILIARCRAACTLLDKLTRAYDAAAEAEDKLSDWIAANQPMRPAMGGSKRWPEDGSKAMRKHLAGMKGCNTKEVVDSYRERIDAVVAFERACKAFDREIGSTRARTAASALDGKSKAAVYRIASTKAMTHLGVSAKAGVLLAWRKAGYELDDEGEELAVSIADDARTVGTCAQAARRLPASRPRAGAEPHPPAQVH